MPVRMFLSDSSETSMSTPRKTANTVEHVTQVNKLRTEPEENAPKQTFWLCFLADCMPRLSGDVELPYMRELGSSKESFQLVEVPAGKCLLNSNA